jgi:hypothetical protein
MKRDSHLPPPEVCDWLLSQEWSEPDTIPLTLDGKNQDGWIANGSQATSPIGRNGYVTLLLDGYDLQILQEDAVARKAEAYEASNLTPEQQLVATINEALASSGVSATAAVGALTMVAIALTSQVYDLKMQPDGEV